MIAQAPAMPVTKYDTIELGGGLDLVTPRLKLKPGAARRMVNYECGLNGGYTRIRGYERYDGRTSPSSVTYRLLPIPVFLAPPPTVGQTLHGVTSDSTGQIIVVEADYLVVTLVLGSGFQQDEMTDVGGVVIGKIGPQVVRLSKTLRKQYVNLAADVYRAFIQTVPGSGPVRGVFGAIFNGVFAVYAFRDTVTGTFCELYKSSPIGWELVPFTIRVEFYEGTTASGTAPVQDGATINYVGLDTYVVQRVMLQSGSWAAGTAAGWLVLKHPLGGSAGAGAFHASGSPYTVGTTTFKTRQYAARIAQQPGGTYEVVAHNFSGLLESKRIYGCDGVNNAFEFDGEVFAPIPMGLEAATYGGNGALYVIAHLDRPTHIMGHQNHLFLSIGSSYLHSGPGTPYIFTALGGGGEGATGDTVTGFQVLPGEQGSGSMAVMGRNQSKILYGTALAGPEPFDLVNFESKTGAIPYTMQTLDRVYYVDDRGIIDLKTAQDYGNFVAATITRFIQPFMELKRGRAVCSTVNRGKNQYRVFFLDGTGLFITLDNGKLRGCAPVAFPHPFTCAWSGEEGSGAERSFVGSRDGYVFEMERGTSFDGEEIDADLLLNWHTMGTPRQRKAFRGASIEFSEETDHVELRFAARLGPELTAHHQEDEDDIKASKTELDMQWDHFRWGTVWYDGHVLSPMELDVKGTSERVQYLLGSRSDYLEPYTLTAVITRYFPRRGLR